MDKKATTLFIALGCLIIAMGVVIGIAATKKGNALGEPTFRASSTIWTYQCIDTMKYSRDTARAWKGKDVELAALIEFQLSTIKNVGANCVAIDTPYDEEFVPFLKAWVAEARTQKLMVWFRGNFSGWEGWFDYPRLTSAQEHTTKTYNFIISHPEIFADGDIFTPAPEAENGLFGNPWRSEQVKQDLRTFVASSYDACERGFIKITKTVRCGFFSANGDVAKSIYTADTINKTGGVVVIDHYVTTVERLINDIVAIHAQDNAPVFLGEYGAPIPDIHGNLTEDQQAELVGKNLQQLYVHNDIVLGLNYWVLTGGSTALLNPDNSPRKVVDMVKNYFLPQIITGTIYNTLGEPLPGISVMVTDGGSAIRTDSTGRYGLVVPGGQHVQLSVIQSGYFIATATMSTMRATSQVQNFFLTPEHPSVWYKLKKAVSGSHTP